MTNVTMPLTSRLTDAVANAPTRNTGGNPFIWVINGEPVTIGGEQISVR